MVKFKTCLTATSWLHVFGKRTWIMNELDAACFENRRVDIVVSLWIHEGADVTEVLQEMNYEFYHPAIRDTEIIDVNTEI
jgi:hypothetical protein